MRCGFMRHVGADVERIDASETGGVQVDKIIKMPHNALQQAMDINLSRVAMSGARHDAVEIGLAKLPLMLEKSWNIDNNDRCKRATELLRVDPFKKPVDDANAIAFIAVNGGRQDVVTIAAKHECKDARDF